MNANEIINAEVTGSYRRMHKYVKARLAMVIWFFVLFIIAEVLIIYILEEAFTQGFNVMGLDIGPADVIIFVFGILFIRTAVHGGNLAFHSPQSVAMNASTLKPADMIRGYTFLSILYNLEILAFILGTATAIILNFDFGVPANAPFVFILILAGINAGSVGMAMTIAGNAPTRLKIMMRMIPASLMITIFAGLVQRFDIMALGTQVMLLACTVVFLFVPQLYAKVYSESYEVVLTRQKRHKGTGTRYSKPTLLLQGMFNFRIRAILHRDSAVKARRHEDISALIGIGVVSFIPMAIYYQSDIVTDVLPSFGDFIYPSILGMSAFIGVMILFMLPALRTMGFESTKLWYIKSLPVSGKEFMTAKVMGMLWLIPIYSNAITLPFAIVAGFTFLGTLLAVIFVCAFSLLTIGIGLAFGARYPNLDEGSDGEPDLMVLYISAMVTIFLTALIQVPAFNIYLIDPVIGIIGAILLLLLSLGIMFLLLGVAGREYEKFEVTI